MRKLTTDELHRLSRADFEQAEKTPIILILDNIRSLSNVGAFFRTADAFRISELFLCGITACPPHPEIHKTALGGEDSVDWRYVPTAVEAVDTLHAEGHFVFAVEQVEGSTLLDDLSIDPERHYAVVFGNEVKGVHQEVVDRCDGCLEIPQRGTKHSMNVSVTAGIVMWEFFRKHTI